jgi:hypothetical protein
MQQMQMCVALLDYHFIRFSGTSVSVLPAFVAILGTRPKLQPKRRKKIISATV